MDGTPAPLTGRARTLRIILIAHAWSVFIYIGIAYLINQQRAAVPAGTLPPALRDSALILAAAAGLAAVVVTWFVGTLLAPRPDPATGMPAANWGKVQTAAIVCAAIAEVPALLGLVLF